MDEISDIKIEPLENSLFVKPIRMKFKQNGVARIWDLVTLHESVNIIIYNTERKKLVFVKQFRPAVFYNSLPGENNLKKEITCHDVKNYGPEGVTLELCAGIVDKNANLDEIAQEEVLEECGYKVPLNKFERVISYRAGIGVSGERQTTFYVEVDDSMKVSEGGGLASEGEFIEVVELSIEEVKDLLKKPHVNSPSGLLFGLIWFLQNKAENYS